MRSLNKEDFSKKYQQVQQPLTEIDVKALLENAILQIKQKSPFPINQPYFMLLYDTLLSCFIEPNNINAHISIIINDLTEDATDINKDVIASFSMELRNIIVSMLDGVATVSSSNEGVSTPNTNENKGKLPTHLAPTVKARHTIKRFDEEYRIFGSFYQNKEDGYIYYQGKEGYQDKRWPIPVILERYVSDTKKEYYYHVEILGEKYILSREELGNGRYRRKLGIALLDSTQYASSYANCITKLGETSSIYPIVSKTGLYKLSDDKWGYMLHSGKMLVGHNQYDETMHFTYSIEQWEETREKEKWIECEKRLDIIKKRDIQELYTFLHNVSQKGLALILECHQARSFFTTLSSDTYKGGHTFLLYGRGGTGKTELSMFTHGLSYPYLYKSSKATTYRGTLSAIELLIDNAKDTPFIIDDLTKAKNETEISLRAKEKIIDAVTRSLQDNKAMRERANGKMELQESHKARTMITFIAEEYPKTLQESTYRRLLSFEILDDEIDRECFKEYAAKVSYTQFALGRRIIELILHQLNTYGKEETVKRIENDFKKIGKRVKELLIEKWKKEQTIELPHYIDYLIDVCSDILIGGKMLDTVSGGVTKFVDDTLAYMVEALYKHILRMCKIFVNEDGEKPLEYALYNLMQNIANGVTFRVGNSSEKLVIGNYKDSSFPKINFSNGNEISRSQWGYDSNTSNLKRAIILRPEQNKAYITKQGKEALLEIFREDERYSKEITTPNAISEQALIEQWIVQLGEGKNKEVKIDTKMYQGRCLVIDLSRLLALLEKDVEKDETQEENVEDEKITSIEKAREKKQDTEDDFKDFVENELMKHLEDES